MFIERINHVTGQREWVVADEDYDMAQELARSRFGDMVLDFDRNDMFLEGLKTVINEMKEQDKGVHVLDIGTGTGLLSLMAAREGADQVTALEVFHPMAKCAKEITKRSEYGKKIEIVSSRSTDLSKLEEKPNVIVAEVFDTELIGEGALRSFKEALQHLTQPGTRVVPSLGRVWVLPVESDFLKKFNRVPRLNGDVYSPSPLGDCPGTSAVFDVQLSQVSKSQFTSLADRALAFSFDFEDADKILYDEIRTIEIPITSSGRVDAILMWWDLDMDRTGKNWIDMAPTWFNPESAWRDHWMQAVYYLPSEVKVKQGETLMLRCAHDEFSMWFAEEKEKEVNLQEVDKNDRPYCSCTLHALLSRHSVFRMSELIDCKVMREQLKKITSGRVVVCISEGSILGLQAAKFASVVYVVDSNIHMRMILHKYKKFYGLSNVHIVDGLENVVETPSVVLSEPFYLSSMTPWDNLRFWFDAQKAKELWPQINVYPKRGNLMGVCEKFVHLWKIGSPVGIVNGFDLSIFDDLSQKARSATDALVDEQPLWEYDGVLSGEPFKVMTFDMNAKPIDVKSTINVPIPPGTNGIPLWMEWEWCDGVSTSTGLLDRESMCENTIPRWNEAFKQGVYLLPPNLIEKKSVKLETVFAHETGDVLFHFMK